VPQNVKENFMQRSPTQTTGCSGARCLLPRLTALVLLISMPALAQLARTEVHAFQSATLTDPQFLNGSKEGKPVTIAGVLRLPRAGTARVPVVVLLHGSGGVGGYVTDWEQDLNSMGVATFVVDSFSARGIVSTNNDQSQLGRLAMIVDAYRALDLLANHPRIDPARIVLMGFSRGGQSALYASVKRFQRLHATAGREFAAYVPFYPSCNTSFGNDDEVSARPVRMFHGSADNYVPIAPCRAYVGRLKAKGADVVLTEYAGAGHVFDGRQFSPPQVLAQGQTTRNCRLEEGAGGAVMNTATQQPFSYRDACVELGPTVAYDEAAATQARKAVREFLAATFAP
jgi:dienelactone hydrolase